MRKASLNRLEECLASRTEPESSMMWDTTLEAVVETDTETDATSNNTPSCGVSSNNNNTPSSDVSSSHEWRRDLAQQLTGIIDSRNERWQGPTIGQDR
jgi:hypothetical protein